MVEDMLLAPEQLFDTRAWFQAFLECSIEKNYKHVWIYLLGPADFPWDRKRAFTLTTARMRDEYREMEQLGKNLRRNTETFR